MLRKIDRTWNFIYLKLNASNERGSSVYSIYSLILESWEIERMWKVIYLKLNASNEGEVLHIIHT